MRRTVLALSAVALLGAPALPLASAEPPAPSAAATTATPSVTLTHEGRTITARFRPIALRSPSFQVLLQSADGTYSRPRVVGERSFLGTVDGDAGATASAIRRADGTLAGQVTFGGGGTWYFECSTVEDDRGLDPTTAFRYPRADEAEDTRTVRTRQVGSTTHRWDIAYDVDASWFADPESGARSVARTLDAVELTTVSLMNSYLVNAKLRPAVGRVVIRGSATRSPYGRDLDAGSELLPITREEWKTRQGPMTWDAVALLYVHTDNGGGNAYSNGITSDFGVSRNAGGGLQRAIVRHELSHNWGVSDNHSNGPEGPTITSGNAYDRFDGTELNNILRIRDEPEKKARLTPVATTGLPLPPYAALDLVGDARAGVTRTVSVLANDHDANNDPIRLTSVSARSARGGLVRLVDGRAVYTPPAVRAADTVDWFRYVVRDRGGRSSVGVVITQVDPA